MKHSLKFLCIFPLLLFTVTLSAQPGLENGVSKFGTLTNTPFSGGPKVVNNDFPNPPTGYQLVWYAIDPNTNAEILLAPQPTNRAMPALSELRITINSDTIGMNQAHTRAPNTYNFRVRAEKDADKRTPVTVTFIVQSRTVTLNNTGVFSTCSNIQFPGTAVSQITNTFDTDLFELVWYVIDGNNQQNELSDQPNDRKKPGIAELYFITSTNQRIDMDEVHTRPPSTYIFKIGLKKRNSATPPDVNSLTTITYTVNANSVAALNGIQDGAVLCLTSNFQIAPVTPGTYKFTIERFINNSKDNSFPTINFPNGPSIEFSPDQIGLSTLFLNIAGDYYSLKITTIGGSCPGTKEIKFYVEEGPVAFFSFGKDDVYCPWESVTFTVSNSTFQTYDPSNYNYIFFIDSDNKDTLTDPSDKDTLIDITGDINALADFSFNYTFTRSKTYDVSLIIQQTDDSSSCNGIWTEKVVIGNPPNFEPDFKISGLRVGKPTQFDLENDNTMKPITKRWYFSVFYAPFTQNTFGNTFYDLLDYVDRESRRSSNVTKTYNLSGVYLAFYENGGDSFSPTDNPDDDIKFCSQLYGLPLIIFDEKKSELLDNWVSSSYLESILKDGESLINLFTNNSDLSLLTTRNSSWQLRDSQTLDSILRENISGQVWITQGADSTNLSYNTDEVSWVQSQFFTIDTLLNPYLTFKVWFNTQPRLDGAVLEYTLGDDENWQRLGNDADVGPNTEWYNERGIASSPGDQSGENLGWSGRSKGWQRMRFSLKEIQEELRVKFPTDSADRVLRIRIAFSSLPDKNLLNSIFAFGELRIDEADRVTLWEHFVGNEAIAATEQEELNTLLINDPFALNISYYTNPLDDSLYHNSPLEPSIGALRELYYGIGSPVNTVLDGQKDPLDSLEVGFERRKLDYTPYIITPVIGTSPLKINYQILKKDTTVFENEHRLRIALVERGVSFKNKLHRNVVRRFLPSHNGQIIPSDLSIGESFNLGTDLNWPTDLTHKEIVGVGSEVDSLNNYPYLLVFFVQDIETKEILQTTYRVISKQEILGREYSPLESSDATTINVFPNPADQYLKINLGKEKNIQHWELRNAWGQLIHQADLDTNNPATIQLDSSHIPAGYYLLVLKTTDHKQITKRVMVVH